MCWAWHQLFSITNTKYKELTLEFLVTFELERGMISFHKTNTIHLQVFRIIHSMRLMEFLVHLGLYDDAFTLTLEYDAF